MSEAIKKPRKAKKKKCKICKGEFIPWNTTQKVDSPECAIEYNKQQDKKAEKKKHNLRKKVFYGSDLKYQHKLTQPVFNKLRRLQELEWFHARGLEPECISCGKKDMDWCCGHLKTVGSQGSLRYDIDNTKLQCNRYCNKGLSGNINGNKTTRGYLVGLVERFGDIEAERIISKCKVDQVRIWTGQELIGMRKEFNKQIRELESLMQLNSN